MNVGFLVKGKGVDMFLDSHACALTSDGLPLMVYGLMVYGIWVCGLWVYGLWVYGLWVYGLWDCGQWVC